MKITLHVLWISLLSFQVFALNGKAPVENIEQYIELSGIEEMIDSMPIQIDAMINQQLLTAENPETVKEEMQVLNYAWDSVEIKTEIVEHIQKNSNNDEINELLEWRKSPLLVKITTAELDATSANFQNELLRYIADLQLTPPTTETMKAIRHLVVATDMVNIMVDMTIQVIKTMTTAFMEAESKNADEIASELNKELDSMRAMITPQMEQQAILMSYYIYRNITNEELARYSSFYESDIGKRELTIISESLSVGMSSWAKKSAVALVENL
jgi:hypothetical protein